MLQSLSIRDVVLIKHLDLSFDEGLVVLTGETGAGKSILLDALGLALGVRAEVRLVRHGAKQAVVSATFNIRLENSIDKILDKHGLEVGNNELILRRVLTSNGKSRSFINDHPVSVSLLKKIGETLVEVHGQFESHRLINTSNHCGLLDSYGGLKQEQAKVSHLYHSWHKAMLARDEAEAEMIRRKAKGEADAILYMKQAEAKGIYEVLTKQAQGLEQIVKAAGNDSKNAVLLLVADKLPELVRLQTEAIKNIKIDKITVWDNGSGNGPENKTSTANFISGLYKSVPPLQEMFNMAGMELPEYLKGKSTDEIQEMAEKVKGETKPDKSKGQ